MQLSERTSLLYAGTIPANGTLSQEIDIAGGNIYGLIYSGATNGTLSFQVSHAPDANGGVYVDVNASNGAAVTYGATGASGAITGTVLEAIRPYRYVKIKMSIAQAGVVQLYLPAKA